MKNGFTLVELLVVITIIGILSSIGLNTFTSAQIKSRDGKRKAYLKQTGDALEAYNNDHGEYPDDLAWGVSFTDDKGTVYMVQLPQDPTLGLSFYYVPEAVAGNNTKYQLYARLENTNDPAVNQDTDNNPLVFENLNCGTKICNYGTSSSNTSPSTGRNLVQE